MRTRSVIWLFLAVNAAGCETDLDVINPDNPTPVVYCILDQDSSVQHLRLSRSYIAKNGEIPPGSPDSILFSRATKVAVEEVANGEVMMRHFFLPMDMVKDSGFFPTLEHWIYQVSFQVKPETEYRLIIYADEIDRIVYSRCLTVGNFQILNPLFPEVRYIHMLPDHNLSFYWTKSRNASIYQLGFIMHYEEIREEQLIEKEILIPLKSIFYLEATENLFSFPINSANFYGYLKENMPSDPGILRKFSSLDAIIISGGEELGYFMRLQESGQTFSLMEYSNIMNGIGIFSSRVIRRINGFKLTEQSIDSLAYGQYTHDLNFMDRTGRRSKE